MQKNGSSQENEKTEWGWLTGEMCAGGQKCDAGSFYIRFVNGGWKG